MTNQAVQKKHPKYKEMVDDTAWTMTQLNDYLNAEVVATSGGKCVENWALDVLPGKMKAIMAHVVGSLKGKLDPRSGLFDFMGLDFIIDEDMNVVLLECNVNPALHTNTTALAEVIPPAVETGLEVAIEVWEKQQAGTPIFPINHPLGTFELIKPVK